MNDSLSLSRINSLWTWTHTNTQSEKSQIKTCLCRICDSYCLVYTSYASAWPQRCNLALCGNLVMNLPMKAQGQEHSNYVYFSGFGWQRVDGTQTGMWSIIQPLNKGINMVGERVNESREWWRTSDRVCTMIWAISSGLSPSRSNLKVTIFLLWVSSWHSATLSPRLEIYMHTHTQGAHIYKHKKYTEKEKHN